jgi:hypothetical protein
MITAGIMIMAGMIVMTVTAAVSHIAGAGINKDE